MVLKVSNLYYGDNLHVLRRSVKDDSVDLIYLDPPFNSDRNYNVLFKKKSGKDSAEVNPQILAFSDTWTWGIDDEVLMNEIIASATPRVSDCIQALYRILGQSDMMSYVVMMAPRLIELHRVLKDSGSIYLHCDPGASHYLKVLLDAVFGPANMLNEVIWQRATGKGDAKRKFASIHDVLLVYAKDSKKSVFNKQFMSGGDEYIDKFNLDDGDGRGPYRSNDLGSPSPRPNLTYPFTAKNGVTYQPPTKGWRVDEKLMRELDEGGRLIYPPNPTGRLRRKYYLSEQGGGIGVGDVWSDIGPLQGQGTEYLGYPTQKPLALLRRVIEASSNPGEVVLDPFCGCGTAVVAAQELGRQWIGIDITYLAVQLIKTRLEEMFPGSVTFKVHGIPTDPESAQALFNANPFDFERWVVTQLQGHPNDKQVGDRGVDGKVRFWHEVDEVRDLILSVKGGRQLNPSMVRDLRGTIERLTKPMGALVCMHEPTPGMITEANAAGLYTHPPSGTQYPKLQIITVSEIFNGKRLNMPTIESPFKRAQQQKVVTQQLDL